MSETTTPGVWPCLSYTDTDAARAFLTGVLGFTETLVVPSEDGSAIVHAEMRRPEGGGIMFGSAMSASDLPAPAGIQWLFVETADPDAVHRRAVEAGAKVLREPYDTDYGARNVSLADPEGNVWTVGTYQGS
ncbi:VOC family protein [Amycolatopsis suaedae]|uniref:Glyoxalase n=1 Tax=Amycolatopsis suaedae TaxID=2510978 RepID=A0A4Q7JEI4_9PSEU|nr:VOC family protein [Amycolatopsis suaedae]RZQ64834.1 glyoxalase [Amycolatopsis suaedae]